MRAGGLSSVSEVMRRWQNGGGGGSSSDSVSPNWSAKPHMSSWSKLVQTTRIERIASVERGPNETKIFDRFAQGIDTASVCKSTRTSLVMAIDRSLSCGQVPNRARMLVRSKPPESFESSRIHNFFNMGVWSRLPRLVKASCDPKTCTLSQRSATRRALQGLACVHRTGLGEKV